MAYGIRERRKELHMTQEQLSAKSNVSRPTIVALERGTAKGVTVRTLYALAEALGTTVDYFFAADVQTIERKDG